LAGQGQQPLAFPIVLLLLPKSDWLLFWMTYDL
jgi:hypothetical protein